jgi:hypothetical protein
MIMKIFLRFVPLLAGISTCGIVAVIGAMFSSNDSSGLALKIVSLVAIGVSFLVVVLVKKIAKEKDNLNQ